MKSSNFFFYFFFEIFSSDVKLAKGSVLEEDVLLGKNVFVGEKSTLHQAIIGANCQIGKNVSIRNCIIYDNVIIGDNCQLVDSVCVILWKKFHASFPFVWFHEFFPIIGHWKISESWKRCYYSWKMCFWRQCANSRKNRHSSGNMACQWKTQFRIFWRWRWRFVCFTELVLFLLTILHLFICNFFRWRKYLWGQSHTLSGCGCLRRFRWWRWRNFVKMGTNSVGWQYFRHCLYHFFGQFRNR